MSFEEIVSSFTVEIGSPKKEEELWSFEAFRNCDRIIRDFSAHPRDFEDIPAEARDSLATSQLPIEDRWSLAIESSREVLAEHSKHLRVMNLLLVALFKTEGPKALLEGAKAHTSYLSEHWAELEPNLKESAKARRNTMLWLTAALEGAVQQFLTANPEPEACRDLAVALDKLVSPPVSDLDGAIQFTASLQGLTRKLEETASKPRSAATRSGVVPSLPEGELGADELVKHMRRIAIQLLDLEPGNATGHAVVRQCVWSFDPSALILNDEGDSVLPAPLAQIIQRCQDLLEGGGDAASMLALSNAQLADHPYWLDLQLLAYTALVEISAPAAQVVARETAAFAARAPELFAAGRYRGGQVSFCSQQTMEWIDSLQTAEESSSSDTSPASVNASKPAAPNDGQLDGIRNQIQKGQARKAILAVAESDAPGLPIGTRIQLRILAAQAALKLRKAPLARSLCASGLRLSAGATFDQLFPELQQSLLETLVQADPQIASVSKEMETPMAELLAHSLESLRPEL